MARISKIYGDNDYQVQYNRDTGVLSVAGIATGGSGSTPGTTVTSSAAELNILDGVTATFAELNYNDIATLGTGAASKAVVLNASGDYTYPATATIVYPSSATLTLQSGSTIDIAGTFNIGAVAMTASAAELNYNDIATLGTGAASKAVVLDSGEDYTWPATGVLTYGVLKDPAGTTLGSTVAELNVLDVSAQQEIIDASGVCSVTKRVTRIEGTGAGAITLAAPDASMLGQVKVITMTAQNGAITLALTNVVGGSQATTASFDAVDETLTLLVGVNKYIVLDEHGVTLS